MPALLNSRQGGLGTVRWWRLVWHHCGCESYATRLGCGKVTHREGHALPILTGINGRHTLNGYENIARHATEPTFEFNECITELQAAGGIKADVQNDFAIFYKLGRYPYRTVDCHHNVRGVTVIGAPFINGADEVGTGRRLAGICNSSVLRFTCA